MKLEHNIKPFRLKRGYWKEKAKVMKIGSSYFLPTPNEYLCLYRAMKGLGFEVRREKEKEGYRVWREK